MKQNEWKFIKYLIHHKHPMTPEQLKQKPFEQIFKNQNEKVDTEEGESDEEEQKSSTSSEMSEQDSKSEIITEDHVFNETTHDEENESETEDDTSQKQNVTEIQTYEYNQEQNVQEEKLLTTNFEVIV